MSGGISSPAGLGATPPPSSIRRLSVPTQLSSAAQEFESVLLGQWLQAAESSFGSAPGSSDQADPCGGQMESFAMQPLARQMVASGGIGIARMVQDALSSAADKSTRSGAIPVAERSSHPSGCQIGRGRNDASTAEASNIGADTCRL